MYVTSPKNDKFRSFMKIEYFLVNMIGEIMNNMIRNSLK